MVKQLNVEDVLLRKSRDLTSRAGGLDVLDLAGGSGYPAIPLAREFPDARIILTGKHVKHDAVLLGGRV